MILPFTTLTLVAVMFSIFRSLVTPVSGVYSPSSRAGASVAAGVGVASGSASVMVILYSISCASSMAVVMPMMVFSTLRSTGNSNLEPFSSALSTLYCSPLALT